MCVCVRTCTEDRKDRKQCRSDRWESSWTLVAKNPLGMVQLSDTAHIEQRSNYHIHFLAYQNSLFPCRVSDLSV